MITELNQALIDSIRNTDWEVEVRRPGFIQSKLIVLEAEALPLKITPNVTLGYDTLLWINEANLYRNGRLDRYPTLFTQAFAENPNWPLDIIRESDADSVQVRACVSALNESWQNSNAPQKIDAFLNYVASLKAIQRFYVVASHISNYCERELSHHNPVLLEFAQPHQALDMDAIHQSILAIQTAPDQDAAIEAHIQNYGWIKTTYNMISPYTKAEVLDEIANLKTPPNTPPPTIPDHPLLLGLRVGIYLRNHIKECSQQLWYAVEPLASSMAAELGLTRDLFFQMTTSEVVESMKIGHSIISETDLANRDGNMIYGFLEGQEIFVVDPIARELEQFVLNKDLQEHRGKSLKGTVACKGTVTGMVRIVLNHSDFASFKPGEILVTTMTTPDFVTLMKKAAAIITDEGGIASHAAVISREFQIPCITGTKIATEMLKNGDLVEVDAITGTVTVL